jgi:hypothetical protein
MVISRAFIPHGQPRTGRVVIGKIYLMVHLWGWQILAVPVLAPKSAPDSPYFIEIGGIVARRPPAGICSASASWAAESRASGTRNGEQET